MTWLDKEREKLRKRFEEMWYKYALDLSEEKELDEK